MRKPALSIRNVLFLTISALSLLVALFTLQQVVQQWTRLDRIRELHNAIIVGDKLFDETESLSVERDVSSLALDTADPALSHDMADRVKEARNDTGEGLSAILPLFQGYRFAGAEPLLQKISDDEANLRRLRAAIDKNLALPYKQRDPKLTDKWFHDATELIIETRGAWSSFMAHFNDIDPMVTLQIRFRYILGSITEYAGQQRALIGRLLVRNRAAGAEEQAQLLRWQGKVDFSWELNNTLGQQAALFPAIEPEFKDARSHYQNVYDMMHDMFYVPGVHPQLPYPISVDLWLELATEATDSLNTLETAALKSSQVYVDGLEGRAKNNIMIRLAVLLSSLALCFYSFRVVTNRVLKPIHELVDALLSTSQGKNVYPLSVPFDRDDEIGKLGRVLLSFQKTMVDIKRYNRDLERSNRELNDFAYIASHDLKEPLRGIHNHSRFLLEDNRGKLDKESLKRIDRLLYLSQRIERLVSDLLYFSRLGRQELAVQPTDIGAVVRDVEGTLDVFLEQNNAKVQVNGKLPVITCDTTRVTEVFRNLIVNGVKYNDSPEKLVEIGFMATCKVAGHEVKNVFSVKDNGRGIPRQFHDEIFRIFRRLERPGVSSEGTGVGLTFVKKIIERHEGAIWLESEPGKGTCFFFTLQQDEEGGKSGRQEVA
jgi:signal transduction histidine kinase